MSILEIKHLFFSYDNASILEDISLSVEKGEFIGIFGPNGGGKTTLLKLILGFFKQDKGTICLSTDKIGYVPQIQRFDKQFPLSLLDLVLMGRLKASSFFDRPSSQDLKLAKEALERVNLLHKENAPFGTLSGGETQRALIARALVSSPKLLILDEPTASIDPKAEELIYSILMELKKEVTILMVTHDLPGIVNRADRLFCIQKHLKTYLPKELCGHFALGLYHP